MSHVEFWTSVGISSIIVPYIMQHLCVQCHHCNGVSVCSAVIVMGCLCAVPLL